MKKCTIFILALFLPLSQLALAEKIRLGNLSEEYDEFDPALDEIPAKKRPEKKEKKQPLIQEVADDFYFQGIRALKKGEIDKAEAFFDRTLILQPDHKRAKEGVDLIMKMYEEPDPPPTPKIKPKPKPKKAKVNPKVQLLKALQSELNVSYKKGQWKRAQDLASKILAIDPKNSAAKKKRAAIHRKLYMRFVGKAKNLLNEGKLGPAIDAYQMAIRYKTDPNIELQIQKLRKMRFAEQKEKSDAYYLKALAATQEGENQRALALCEQALQFNPDNLQAKRMYERLQSMTPR